MHGKISHRIIKGLDCPDTDALSLFKLTFRLQIIGKGLHFCPHLTIVCHIILNDDGRCIGLILRMIFQVLLNTGKTVNEIINDHDIPLPFYAFNR